MARLLAVGFATFLVKTSGHELQLEELAMAGMVPALGRLQSETVASAGPPVVFMHGMGDSGSNSGMKSVCDSVSEKFSGTYSKCLDVANGLSSITETMDKQLEEFVQAVRSDPKLADGFNAVGLSQGNLLIRAYIERYNSPKVLTYVSLCGVHNGIAKCPEIYNLVCGLWKLDVYGHSIVFSDYWKDPTDQATYLAKSRFLADINNERTAKNATYKANMESLTKYVLVEAMQDTMVQPHVSEQHGYYAWGQETTTQQLEETDAFKEDWLGLQTLQKAGKLQKLSYQGDHLQWSQDFWETQILPLLGPVSEQIVV